MRALPVLTWIFAAIASGQGTPVAVLSCDQCYVAVDAAQVIIAATSSGSDRLITTISRQLPQFSFGTEGLIDLSGQATNIPYVPLTGTAITLGQVTLVSPTAYIVIGKYTQYTLFQSSGVCFTSNPPPVTVQSPFSQSFGLNADGSAILAAETNFIQQLTFLTCDLNGDVSLSRSSSPSASGTSPRSTAPPSLSLSSTSVQTISTTGSSNTATPNSGLSLSARIGVGFGVAISAVIFATLLLWFIYSRRQKAKRRGSTDSRYQLVEIAKDNTVVLAEPGVAVDNEPGIAVGRDIRR